MIDDLYYGAGACPCCSGERLYNASAGITFDAQVFEGFLREMYEGFDVSTEIEPSVWREALRIINQGTVQGLAEAEYPDHDKTFLRELKQSNEVFAAFKVHKMGNQMAERMLRADGSLKPFDEWVKDIQGISSHYIGSWLRTEYDMAITRAHQAAEWQEFERNKDVMPNLRWMPTTSPAPEIAHRYFWERGVCLPVDDAFWRRHRPGDRWNCKCSLQATDGPVVHPDGLDDTPDTAPQRGLENNPKDGRLFSDKHPYFPSSCASCSFYKAGGRGGAMNWLKRKFENRQKDCYSCPFAQEAVDKAKIAEGDVYTPDETYGERLQISALADKNDLADNMRVAQTLLDSFPGMEVKIRPDYRHLITGMKNPELLINGNIGDNKRPRGWTGITTGISKAINEQGCSVVVIDLDAHLKSLNLNKVSQAIAWRGEDFKSGKLKECYVVFRGKAVCINEALSKGKIKAILRRLEPQPQGRGSN